MNAALTGPEREVLALLVASGLRYDGIGELLGIDRQGVAEIAAQARRWMPADVRARIRGSL